MKLRIAGIQMAVGSDIPGNVRSIHNAVDRAGDEYADLLLTPEGSLSGYTSHHDRDRLEAALRETSEKASGRNLGLALGTCRWESDGKCYNQVRFQTQDGVARGFHAKILRCSPLADPGSGEMSEFSSIPLRVFELRGVVFGCLICCDLWATPGYTTIPNPYLPWELKKKGARFILHAVNSGGDQRYRAFHESSLALWAQALGIPIVTVNAGVREGPVNASSGIMGPKGEWLLKVPDIREQYFCLEIGV